MDNLDLLKNYRMPGEFEKHEGCILIWPVRPGSWPYGGVAAQKAFVAVAEAIADSEKVFLLADRDHMDEAKEKTSHISNLQVLCIESNDAWARDVGPTYVINDAGHRIGIDWKFNAWGGDFDGLYADYDKDDKVAALFCKELKDEVFTAKPFVLEGGSIHSDGQGTIMVTEACLLSKGRNPSMSKSEIETMLKNTLGGKKVIWLPRGIYNDETNEHVDNICAFVKPGKVVLAWTEDRNDPQYEMSLACEKVLLEEGIEVVHLPIPSVPILIKEEDLQGYVFEEGEDVREVGERLAASYVNFYISNHGIIMPQFGDDNDELAYNILQECFSDRKVYKIAARDILVGGGNIHCITQQIPEAIK